MARYKHKLAQIEAIQWDGNNTSSVVGFIDGKRPENPHSLGESGIHLKQKPNGFIHPVTFSWSLIVPDIGEVFPGDWIARDSEGRLRYISEHVFEANYEAISDD